jgi:hypothetical protein
VHSFEDSDLPGVCAEIAPGQRSRIDRGLGEDHTQLSFSFREVITMRRTCFSHLSIPLCAAIALTLAAPPEAHAEVKGLTVLAAKDIGPFRGKAYREVQARMEGTAQGGAYAVRSLLPSPNRLPTTTALRWWT